MQARFTIQGVLLAGKAVTVNPGPVGQTGHGGDNRRGVRSERRAQNGARFAASTGSREPYDLP